MYICMYTYIYMHIYIHICSSYVYMYIHVYLYTFIYVYTHVYIHIYIQQICMHIYSHIHVHVCIYKYLYVYIHKHTAATLDHCGIWCTHNIQRESGRFRGPRNRVTGCFFRFWWHAAADCLFEPPVCLSPSHVNIYVPWHLCYFPYVSHLPYVSFADMYICILCIVACCRWLPFWTASMSFPFPLATDYRSLWRIYIHICIYKYIYIYVCMYVHIYIYMHIYIHIYSSYVYMYVHVYLYIFE